MLLRETSMRVVDHLAFGHDGRLYAAGHGDDRGSGGGINVWNSSNGLAPVSHLLPNHGINGLIVNSTGRRLYASANGPTREPTGYCAVDPSGGTPEWLGLNAWDSFWMALHPSGVRMIGYGCVGNWQKQLLVRWRQHPDGPAEKVWERSLPHGDKPKRMVCDPNGSRIHTLEADRRGMQLAARDPSDWSLLGRTPLPGRKFNRLTVAPDGAYAVVLAGSSLLVCDLGRFGSKPKKIHGGEQYFRGIAFHPSGRLLAAASGDTAVKLYDTRTWRVTQTFTWDVGRFPSVDNYGNLGASGPRRKRTTWKVGGLQSVAFSTDGLLAAAGSNTGKIVVWDVDL